MSRKIDNQALKNDFLEISDDEILQQFRIDSSRFFNESHLDDDGTKTVKPEAGFCVKTRAANGSEKIFINICKSTELPPPRDVSEEELSTILQSENPSDYKVPLSLGEVHFESDKSGKACRAYDVTINAEFYQKVEKNLLFKTFIVTVAMEGLEDKYNIELDKNDWIILKNRPYLGKIPVIKIRNQSKPLVTEIVSKEVKVVDESPEIGDSGYKHKKPDPVKPQRGEVPDFKLQKLVQGLDKKMLKAEIRLPGVVCQDIILDVGEDRIVLSALTKDKLKQYFLDIYIPINVVSSKTTARFIAKQEILNISMPISAVKN